MRCRKTWREVQCFFSELKEQRNQEQGCDVTIRVDDQAFPSHSWLLAASCPYFKAMFTSSARETEVHLNGMTPDTFKIIWNYIYGTEIDIKDENEAIQIIEGAQLLGMDLLYASAVEVLKSLLNTNNVVNLLAVADQLGIAELEAAALNHICANFEAIVPRPEFLEMSLDHFSDLISRDELKVTKEEVVYEAVRSWTTHGDRQEHLPDLLEKVRLALLSLEYLQKELTTDDSLYAHPKCIRLVQHAKDYHVPQLQNMVPAHLYQPRICFRSNFAQFQLEEKGKKQTTKKFQKQRAQQSTPSNNPPIQFSIPPPIPPGATATPPSGPALLKSFLNFMEAPNQALQTLASLNLGPSPSTNLGQQSNPSQKYLIWALSKKAQERLLIGISVQGNGQGWSIPKSVIYPFKDENFTSSVIAVEDKVFLIGYQVKFFNLNSLGNWFNVQKPPNMVMRSACAAFDRSIFVCGGGSASGYTNFVSQFDIGQSRWVRLPVMSTERESASAAMQNQILYVSGGLSPSGQLRLFERLDTRMGSWQQLCDLPFTMLNHASTFHNGRLHASGGLRMDNVQRDVMVYEENMNRWVELPGMMELRHRHGLVSLNGSLYAIGGSHESTIETWDGSCWKRVTSFKGHFMHKAFGPLVDLNV